VSLDSGARDPSRIARGQLGARTRWGAPRIVRLDSLTTAQRDLVLALVNTMKAAPVSETSGAATTGGTRDADLSA
jgi:hypothetical protein